jgi:hypothetical protein
MSFTPSVVATLATSGAIKDLYVLLSSLAIFNANPPTVYLFCDSGVAKRVGEFKYPGRLVMREDLGAYAGWNRQQMEQMPGVHFKSRWFDFMAEKINLLRWALSEEKGGVLFCDADICFLAPLPEIPEGRTLALSPHAIRPRDALRFGHYNGGFLWLSSEKHLDVWWTACATARFYEQSALEDVAVAADSLYEFPVTQNYGWWRLLQGTESPEALQKKWSIHLERGILVSGVPLGSVHTHFAEKLDSATCYFNELVLGCLKRLAVAHPPANRLVAAIAGALKI